MKKTYKKYDVFISYRRDGGIHLAKLIQENLTEKGYRVFMDVENLKSGKFNEQLYSIIDGCDDVLLICSPGAMDRFSNPDDWVRLEITHAMKSGKNIIPIMERGFSFPPQDSLPAELRELVYYHALTAEMELFPESIDKLCRNYLVSKPIRKIKNILLACAGAAVIGISLLLAAYGAPQKLPENCKAADQLCTLAVGTVENGGSAVLKALNYCRRYVDGDIEQKELSEHCRMQREAVESASALLNASDALIAAAEDSSFCKDILKTVDDSSVFKNYIDFAEALAAEPYISVSQKKEGFDHLKKIVECSYLITLDEAYGALLPMMRDSQSYNDSETVSYVFNVSTSSELSACVNDSLFGQGSNGVSEQSIAKIIDGMRKTIQQSKTALGGIAGSIWTEYDG